MTSPNHYAIASAILDAGISVIPIRRDSPKHPALKSWDPYKERLPTKSEAKSWWGGKLLGFAAIGGSVSGGLECLDFDYPGLFERWADELEVQAPGLVHRLVIVHTPKGGAHAWFRSDACEPSQALAWRPPTEAERRERPNRDKYKLVETRGAEGYALLPGSPPECHELGKPYVYAGLGLGDICKVQQVTTEERELMFALARSYNQVAEPARGPRPLPRRLDGLSPGDDFDRRGSWQEVLEPAGWTVASGDWESGRLCRPGKSHGWSATVGVCRGPSDEPLLHVFSTDAAPLSEGTYGRFRAYAILHHNAEWIHAAQALYERGFGDRREVQQQAASTAKGKKKLEEPGGFSAADLMQKDFPEIRWAIEGLMCEGLTVLGGKPKGGKSWLALLIAWAVAAGQELDGRKCASGTVLALLLEDSYRRLKARLQMLGQAVKWPIPANLHLRTEWPRADQGGLQLLVDWLTARPETRLVVIDTLQPFRKPSKAVGNNYAEDYESLRSIQQVALQHRCTILVVHHTRKLKAEDPFDELSGTLAISGAADGLMVLERDRGATGGKLFVTGRDIDEVTIPLTLDRESWRWTLGEASEGITTTGRISNPANNQIEACKAWIRKFLERFAYPSKELTAAAKEAGFSFWVVRDAKTELGKGESESERLINHQLAKGDWWCGFGPVANWVKRPADCRHGGADQFYEDLPP